MNIRMDGRTALITGGSKGLGLAMASTFASAGADVAIVARSATGLAEAQTAIEKASGRKALTLAYDVATSQGVEGAYRDAVAKLGRIDILVNNAGTARTGVFEEVTDAMWQMDLDLKLFAAIRFARLAFPGMKERRWGRIINVLNTAAKAPRAGSAPTSVSRAAGLALTKVLAGEGAPHNVLVNALLVGLIKSDQHDQKAMAAKVDPEEWYRKLGAPVPVGRVGEPQEFANIACLLASDAGSYITGTAINVDGGMSPVP